MNYKKELGNKFLQSQRQNVTKNLTYAEKLNRRIEILTYFMNKNATIRDKIRNIAEIRLANENDFEVQIDTHFKLKFLQGELQRLYSETDEKLKVLRKPRTN